MTHHHQHFIIVIELRVVDQIIFLLNDVYNALLDANEGGKEGHSKSEEREMIIQLITIHNGHLIVVILGSADINSCYSFIRLLFHLHSGY